MDSPSLAGAEHFIGDATGTHESNYIEWDSAHCLHPWNVFPNETAALVLRICIHGRRQSSATLNCLLSEDNTIDEGGAISFTPEWVVPLPELQSPLLPYPWEKEVRIVAI